VSAGFAQATWVVYGTSRRGAFAIQRADRADAGRRHYARGVHTINPQATHTAATLSSSEDRSDCGLAESGARIAPEPIDTRKRKESRASIHRTPSVMQCPMLLAFFVRHLGSGLHGQKDRVVPAVRERLLSGIGQCQLDQPDSSKGIRRPNQFNDRSTCHP